MKLKITHTTRYAYDHPVDYALQRLRLRPNNNGLQTVHDWALDNQSDLVSAIPGTSSIEVTASGTVETHDTAGILGKVYGAAPLWHYRQQTDRTLPGKAIRSLGKSLTRSGDQVAILHALSTEILKIAPYAIGHTYNDTTAEEALTGGSGVCQDHAQIFASACRVAGMPARYVSGYLMLDDREDQDASHAWAEVHLDDLGWVGFDVSNGVSPDGRYVRLATGLDAREAAPVSGLRLGNSNESMIVSLQVQQ